MQWNLESAVPGGLPSSNLTVEWEHGPFWAVIISTILCNTKPLPQKQAFDSSLWSKKLEKLVHSLPLIFDDILFHDHFQNIYIKKEEKEGSLPEDNSRPWLSNGGGNSLVGEGNSCCLQIICRGHPFTYVLGIFSFEPQS